MTDPTYGATSDHASEDIDLETPPTAEVPGKAGQVSAWDSAQRRLASARTSIGDITSRAKTSATLPSRRTVRPSADRADAPAITLADRAQAYRAHIVSAAVAVAALLAVVLKRRASAHDVADEFDLGEWSLHAEPVDE